jgi:hypothetical protein
MFANGCHSADRRRIEAQIECGIGKEYTNPEDMDQWLKIWY